MTMRMPSRSLSSRMSEMPSIFFSLHELGDVLDQLGLVDLVGDLGDDDRLAVALLSSIKALACMVMDAAAGLVGSNRCPPGRG
jgi:hypothetical protein